VILGEKAFSGGRRDYGNPLLEGLKGEEYGQKKGFLKKSSGKEEKTWVNRGSDLVIFHCLKEERIS